MNLIPWDLILSTLKGLGFNAMAGFVEFYKNRDSIITTFSDNKRRLANIGKFQAELFDKYNPHADPMIKELVKFGPEYLAYVVPEESMPEIYDFFIKLGQTLEIKRQQLRDPLLQTVSNYGGELKRISRL